MDDPATEESNLPWEDDGDEEQNEEHCYGGIFADPGIIFPFRPGTNVKGQISGESFMMDLPCEVAGQYADRKHDNADCPPTDYNQASCE